jgi:hypothetical protein
LSFYNIDKKNGQCFLWDETQGGRGSCEVATCLYLYISSIAGDVSSIYLYEVLTVEVVVEKDGFWFRF